EAGVGVFEAGKQVISLRASRMEMDLVTRSIKAFSNAIADAGGSASDLGPALVNLSQFLATRHINQIDLRQLSNRMPQTMDVLLNTFGTVDPKELNKVPIEEFIEGLVSGLEKIPPVAAGAKITMEQFVDTIRVTSGTIGEAIEKSFNISDNIKLLGDAINNLTDHFRALSPEAKKSILAVGSLAVIIPSLTLAIGGLVKLVPIIVTGFGLISGSAVAVVAAVGVATAAIITNWDKVKKFLQDSGFWNNMVTVARSALNVIVEVVKLGLNLIQGDWVNFGNA